MAMEMASFSSLSYVDIPAYARRLDDTGSPSGSPVLEKEQPRTLPQIVTALPHSDSSSAAVASPRVAEDPASPRQSAFNIPALLLSSALPSGPVQSDPRGQGKLLSTKDPLSIPITTANFRRFVAKVGPVFWLQDRVEEVVTWKKGWKVTCAWMAAYAFLCYFPALVLVLPNALLISVLLATHPAANDQDPSAKVAPPTPPGEGSVDWQANLQAIQNLMGAYSDLYDAVVPLLPHIMHQTPVTAPLLVASTLLLVLSIPLVSVAPLRPLCLVLGLAPFVLAHPLVAGHLLPAATARARELARRHRQRLLRAVDDDALADRHWCAPLREVELWENERWVPSASAPLPVSTSSGDDVLSPTIGGHAEPAVGGTWSKAHLRAGERLAWTRGRDGWSAVGADGGGVVSSNLTFALDAGWGFVETEDWRTDLCASWAAGGGDDCGWVYSNDVWMEGSAVPRDEWANTGMTRRRRWTRRIYRDTGVV